ncbi:MAG TPA: SUMF1/EgtB/PvdO family nonheme iron enzyme [Candidatus Binataceae bacterium]|nr:SUMF1/EgtB/PvdO family nonheme iron enzyme [Candidatus Binataceae bacterium]
MADDRAPASPNQMPMREAMGLPHHLVRRADQTPLARYVDLRRKSAEQLAAIAENADVEFARRHAAGLLLGLVGDPRIRPDYPQMIDLPGGHFRRGLDPDDVDTVLARWHQVGVQRSWISKECPSHDVILQPFRMARYPVTNVEYLRFLEDTGAPAFPSSWRFGTFPVPYSNHPVWTVPPHAANAYAAWLAQKTQRPFRLPTEAEWEYAAGGPERREYPWGESFEPWRANTVEAGPLQTTPVGIYPDGASPFGLLDMGGNVEELVADLYTPYPGGEPISDDLGTAGSYRIARGGSFTRFGDLTRCRRRHGWYHTELYAIGFRLAENA